MGGSESLIEGQKTECPKEKGQKDKQRSTKHYTKNKQSSNTNSTKTSGELVRSGRESSSCSTSGTRRVTLVTNPVISYE